MTTGSSTTSFDAPAYGQSSHDDSSTKDVAKDQAAGVAGSAKDAGQHVAGVAKDQAGNVATEATRQARDILGQTRAEISQQAADQQQRVAGGLRSLGTELGSMAERGEESGVATDLARQASTRAHDLADWLEQRDPAGLLDEVKTFARRRPGAFLAIAAGVGLAAGRLTRGLKDESTNSSDSRSAATVSPTPASTSAGPTGYGSTAGESASFSNGEYATDGGAYGTDGGYGTEPAPVAAVVVEPVVPPAHVTGRQYPEGGTPLNEEGRP